MEKFLNAANNNWHKCLQTEVPAAADKHSCEIAIRCDWLFEMNTECMAGAGGLISYLYLIMA